MSSTRPGVGQPPDDDKTPRASGAWLICHARAEYVADRCDHAALMMTKRLEVISARGAATAMRLGAEARALAAQFSEWRPSSSSDFEGWAALRDRLVQLEEEVDAMFELHDTHPTVRLVKHEPVSQLERR